MQYNDDEKLFQAICEQMGILLEDTPGEAVIEGQVASEYLSCHKIFEDDYSNSDFAWSNDDPLQSGEKNSDRQWDFTDTTSCAA